MKPAIAREEIEYTLQTKGWQRIAERLAEAIAEASRGAIDAEGDEHLRKKFFLRGLERAARIPEILLGETNK